MKNENQIGGLVFIGNVAPADIKNHRAAMNGLDGELMDWAYGTTGWRLKGWRAAYMAPKDIKQFIINIEKIKDGI